MIITEVSFFWPQHLIAFEERCPVFRPQTMSIVYVSRYFETAFGEVPNENNRLNLNVNIMARYNTCLPGNI